MSVLLVSVELSGRMTPEDQLLIELYNANVLRKEIARRLGCNETTVKRRLERLGVPRRQKPKPALVAKRFRIAPRRPSKKKSASACGVRLAFGG